MLHRSVLCLALVCAISPNTSAQSRIPTPESVIGFAPGAEHKLATYDQTIEYFKKLDAASDHMTLVEAGTSTQGRTYYYALISTPANLKKVDRYREIARRLARPEGLTEAQAQALAKEAKPLVHIDGGLHSTEVAGPQHTLLLAYDLLSKTNDPQIARILDNVVLMLWPTINPDGHQMVADWYMKNAGSANESLPRLYQEYVGHDNNRDAYMLNMIESRVMEHAWRQWEPQIIYVQHQSSPFPTRIWLPPFAEPIATHAPYLMSREVNTIGMQIAQGLEERGMVGATHMGTGYDAWYAGYIDYTPMFKNIASFWTETALAGLANTREYTLQDYPQDYKDLRPQALYTSPWQPGNVDAPRRRQLHGGGVAVGARLCGALQGERAAQSLSLGAAADRAASEEWAVRVFHSASAARHADRGRNVAAPRLRRCARVATHRAGDGAGRDVSGRHMGDSHGPGVHRVGARSARSADLS